MTLKILSIFLLKKTNLLKINISGLSKKESSKIILLSINWFNKTKIYVKNRINK